MSSNIGLVVNPKTGFVGIGTAMPTSQFHVHGPTFLTSMSVGEMAGPILPSESNVFPVGSSNNRFLDAYFSRAVDISGVAISPDATGSGIKVTSAATGALVNIQANYVQASNIKSIGDVQAAYVLGSNIRSVGDVQAAYVQASNIKSIGDVQAAYVIGSNIRSIGDVQAAYVLGSNIRSVGDVQAQNITASGLLTASNIRVLGDYVILDTITSNTEMMVITNAGTGPALKVTQTGANSIAEFYDDSNALAFKVANDGLVGIGTTNPLAKLHVIGSGLISSNLVVSGGDIRTGAAIASTLFADTTTGSIAIGGALTTGTVTLGATGSTGAVSLFPATGTQAITLGGATTGTITLGSTSASAVQLPTGKTKVGTTTLVQGGAVSVTLPAIAGTLLTVENALTSGTTDVGFLKYNGTTAVAGQLDGSTTTPTGTTRLNYGGYFYPTAVNMVGTGDTVTAATHYFVETGSDGFVRPKTLANTKAELVTTASVNSAAATTVGTITSGVWNAGAVTSSGNVSAGAQVLAPSGGLVGAPGFSWTGNTNTGIYQPATNELGIVTNGGERIRVSATGNVGIGTANPQNALHVQGTAQATTFSGSGSSLTTLNADNVSTGTLAVARGGTGATSSTGTGNVVLQSSPTINGNLTLGSATGNCFIGGGGFDNASLSEYNLKIRSWWGIGFPSYDNVNRITMDTRTGNISISGTIQNLSGRPMVKQTGGVLQVVNVNSSPSSTTSGVIHTLKITPSSTSSKILLIASVNEERANGTSSHHVYVYLYRNGANIAGAWGNALGWQVANYVRQSGNTSCIDSPETTSEVTYTFYVDASQAGGALYYWYSNSLTAIEIAG